MGGNRVLTGAFLIFFLLHTRYSYYFYYYRMIGFAATFLLTGRAHVSPTLAE